MNRTKIVKTPKLYNNVIWRILSYDADIRSRVLCITLNAAEGGGA